MYKIFKQNDNYDRSFKEVVIDSVSDLQSLGGTFAPGSKAYCPSTGKKYVKAPTIGWKEVPDSDSISYLAGNGISIDDGAISINAGEGIEFDEDGKLMLGTTASNSEYWTKPKEIRPYVYEMIYDDEDYIYVNEYFNQPDADIPPLGGCSAFVLSKNNKKISYVTDAEFTPDNIDESNLYYKACFESSDLLLLDSQYSLVEFFSKFQWGHTASTVAVNLALDWRIKQLAMFHFDPEHSDEDLSRMLIEAKSLTNPKYNNRNLKIIQAIEGTTIEV